MAAIVVFDVYTPATFQKVLKWKNDIDEKVHLPHTDIPIPTLLLANKCDLTPEIPMTEQELNDFCDEHNFIGWFNTSAKENTNVDKAMMYLVQKIMHALVKDGDDLVHPKNSGIVDPSKKRQAAPEESGCGC